MSGIVEGRYIAENRILTPEFCIIGSGAAGGVCALKLAEAGFDVLVLEEGGSRPSWRVRREKCLYRNLSPECVRHLLHRAFLILSAE